MSAAAVFAERLDAMEFAELHWQMIGPVRASRTNAADLIPDNPNVLHVGAVDDGVSKPGDAARAWLPN